MSLKTNFDNTHITQSEFIDLIQIEKILKSCPLFEEFWNYSGAQMIVHSFAKSELPIYEIQLAFHCSERIESYAWVWIDAIAGEIISLYLEE